MNRNMNPKVSLINLVWSSMLIKWAFITLSILFFSVALILAELGGLAERILSKPYRLVLFILDEGNRKSCQT